MNPDKGEPAPFGDLTYVGRLYWDGEPDKEMIWRGAADAWWAMAWPRMQAAPWVKIWEGPNEPAVDTPEKARLFAEFELRRIELLHAHGLRAASGVFSTGNILLELWPLLGEVLAATDYLALHGYGMKTERPQMGRSEWNLWHLYRHEKVIATLRANNLRVPPILLTETGIDYAGNPQSDGWKAQGLSPQQFMGQIAGFAEGLSPEILMASPFTWQPENWPSFDMNGEISALYTAYLKGKNVSDAETGSLLAEIMQAYVIPQNPAAGFYAYGRARGWEPISAEKDISLAEQAYRCQMWYSPESQTQHLVFCEVGNWGAIRHTDRAN
jgi:hypothetical protein